MTCIDYVLTLVKQSLLLIILIYTCMHSPLAVSSAQSVLIANKTPLNILSPISQLAADLNTDVAVTVPFAFEYTKSIVMVSMLMSHDNSEVIKFSKVILQLHARDRILVNSFNSWVLKTVDVKVTS